MSAGLAARIAGNAVYTPGSEWAISAVPDDFINVCVCFDYIIRGSLCCHELYDFSPFVHFLSTFHRQF